MDQPESPLTSTAGRSPFSTFLMRVSRGTVAVCWTGLFRAFEGDWQGVICASRRTARSELRSLDFMKPPFLAGGQVYSTKRESGNSSARVDIFSIRNSGADPPLFGSSRKYTQ